MSKFIATTFSLVLVILTFMLWEGKFGVRFSEVGRIGYGLSLLFFALLLGWITFKSAKRGT